MFVFDWFLKRPKILKLTKMDHLFPPSIITIVDNLFSYPYLRFGTYQFNSEWIFSIFVMFVMFPSADYLVS